MNASYTPIYEEIVFFLSNLCILYKSDICNQHSRKAATACPFRRPGVDGNSFFAPVSSPVLCEPRTAPMNTSYILIYEEIVTFR